MSRAKKRQQERRMVEIPPQTYKRAMAVAKWQETTPPEVELGERALDQLQELIGDLLCPHLPMGDAPIDVETGRDDTLWAVVEDGRGDEHRVRLVVETRRNGDKKRREQRAQAAR